MLIDQKDPNSQKELCEILNELIQNWEDEVVEFKEAGKDFKQDEIGRYFSAISNEANLRGIQHGWLVFGVRNKDRVVVGSDYRNTEGLQKLKHEIAQQTTDGISFIEIYELSVPVNGEEKRVVMFQIPAAATAIPTAWKNHFYARDGESLAALSIEKQDRIRRQEKKDWSKQTIPNAGIECLDPNAIALAKQNYKVKMNRQHISEETDTVSDYDFLTRNKLIINGQITNAALLLLGKEEYDYLFASAPEVSWRLFDYNEEIQDYEIFKIPFITVADRLFAKIRNSTYRYMPSQLTLFPAETKQYDPWLLHELINNCIAHTDYMVGNRIYIHEFEKKLMFTNPGSFLPGSIEVVLKPSYSPPFYRNQLLAEAMVKFNMIDTQAMGIRKVFRIQRDKFFPMPDYDFSSSKEVNVTVYGKILDENYSRVLFDNPNFDLTTVFWIDRVQKREKISKDALQYLRKLGVVEGRVPNIYISAKVAASMDEKEQYVKNKGFDEEAYKMWILNYLKKFGKGSKSDILALLRDKLPDTLSEQQKSDKVRNLLQTLKREGKIITDSNSRRTAKWMLV